VNEKNNILKRKREREHQETCIRTSEKHGETETTEKSSRQCSPIVSSLGRGEAKDTITE
jgi:hypothetical protein